MENQQIKKSVIFTDYECNNNCRFCMEQDLRGTSYRETDDIKMEMKMAKTRGTDYVELIGGEMTTRKDFLELIRFADSLDFGTIMIATNGRMFSYYDYAYKAVKAGLTDIVFSIHGHTPEIHDYLTRTPGSFDQLHQGIKNIAKAAKELKKDLFMGSNTTIVKPNYKTLPELGKHIRSLGIHNSEFIFVDCNEGGAYHNFYELVPKISDAAFYMRKCLDLFSPKKGISNWDVRYVPLCYFLDYLNQISELKESVFFQTEHLDATEDRRDYDYVASRKKHARIKPEKCKKCALYDYCEGLWVTYYQNYGDDELKPVRKISKEQKKLLNSI